MSVINVTNLTFAYGGGENVFENVSFQLDTDWRLGFTGRNGRGKTTFLRLLMGEYEYSGTISSSVDFHYFPSDVPDATLSTLDAVSFPGLEQWELTRELSLLGLKEEALSRPFCSLSGGERTKAQLAALFLKKNGFPLIDEPTNHLDRHARELLGGYLKSKKGFILVSHDRALLDASIDHVLSINRTNIEVCKGSFSTWLSNKQMRDNFELAQNERLKKDIKKLSAAAKRTSDWSDKVEKTKRGKPNREQGVKADKGFIGHKSAKMMKRSKSIEARKENAANDKAGLLKNVEASETLALKPLSHHSEHIAAFEDISIFYGERPVCQNISFTLNRGERLWLSGGNGSGKTSILKLAAGESIAYTGELRLASGIVVSYVPQETGSLSGTLEAFAARKSLSEPLLKAILRKLGFPRAQLDKDIRGFSEGQKKKVALAGSLCESAHLYIWDEPLNYIDVISRIQIEELILEHKPTLLFVEHDAAFASKIATTGVLL